MMRKLKKYKPTKFMAKDSRYNKDAADFAVMFIESLCHTKGTWAGQPFELIDWQEQIIRDLFGILKPNGYRQFNTAYIEIPKKQGNEADAACSSDGDEEKFWKLMEERTELCHKALRIRHETMLGTPSDVAPILWQYGAISRLAKGEKIDRLLYDNYSTISLGYAGLSECVYRMKGVSHTDPAGHDFGIEVMKFLNRKTAQWREAENISYSLYGTPIDDEMAVCVWKDGHVDSGSMRSICDCLASR